MAVKAYYNEHDPKAAAWLTELIRAKVIADGIVDSRSITNVDVKDLHDFTQCHFFAGIGVWSYALRQAGWPDDQQVWTGSCPCQPFSASGKKKGFDDERHLWPVWFNLIALGRPPVVFGEQVASKDGLKWLDLVQTDLENQNYATGAFDLCAAGVGAPHIRQRLYFVADTNNAGSQGWQRRELSERAGELIVGTSGASGELADSNGGQQGDGHLQRGGGHGQLAENTPTVDSSVVNPASEQMGIPRCTRVTGVTNGFWSDADWIYCRDGKYRPVEPGTFPLVTGAPARVGRLRGYGNALCAEVAITFINSYREARGMSVAT